MCLLVLQKPKKVHMLLPYLGNPESAQDLPVCWCLKRVVKEGTRGLGGKVRPVGESSCVLGGAEETQGEDWACGFSDSVQTEFLCFQLLFH